MSSKAYFDFKEKYYKPIMKLIEAQRLAYPETGIHGYSHIGRCIVLTHVLSRLHKLSYNSELKCLIAIGLHDVAREDDGEDLWEQESANIANDFCLKFGFSKEFADDVSGLITDKTDYRDLPNKKFIVCHDADCLDIIRVFGIDGFREFNFVSFKNDYELRSNLIQDTCQLIDDTYLDEYEFDNIDCLYLMEHRVKSAWNWKLKIINKYIIKE
jgi:hypothetical protein